MAEFLLTNYDSFVQRYPTWSQQFSFPSRSSCRPFGALKLLSAVLDNVLLQHLSTWLSWHTEIKRKILSQGHRWRRLSPSWESSRSILATSKILRDRWQIQGSDERRGQLTSVFFSPVWRRGDCATCQILLAGQFTKPCVAKVRSIIEKCSVFWHTVYDLYFITFQTWTAFAHLVPLWNEGTTWTYA